jgi:hypothetical protein
MQIDLDHVQNYDKLFKKICSDKFTYIAFKSPGGNGIKVAIKIHPDKNTHYNQFKSLQEYYQEQFNIEIDAACKDVGRGMLLSYDTNLFCNPTASTFDEVWIPPINIVEEEPANYNTTGSVAFSGNTEELVAS